MADDYTPDEETVREQYSREQPPHIGTVGEKQAEFDRFIRKVERDAAREALDGLAAWMSDLHDKYPSHAWYVPLSLDNITRYTTDNYPEETP